MALEVGKIYMYTSKNYPLEIYKVAYIQGSFYHIHTLIGTLGSSGSTILQTGAIQANSTLFETTATTLKEFQDLHPELFI